MTKPGGFFARRYDLGKHMVCSSIWTVSSSGISFAKFLGMDTTKPSMTGMPGAKYLLRHLHELGLKYFQETNSLDDDCRIMIPSQEIVVSRDLANKTFQITISLVDR